MVIAVAYWSTIGVVVNVMGFFVIVMKFVRFRSLGTRALSCGWTFKICPTPKWQHFK